MFAIDLKIKKIRVNNKFLTELETLTSRSDQLTEIGCKNSNASHKEEVFILF